mmetsp:Transcript_14505/g.41325  ORF Transcript_14505/g.41325 Transcript_14505/m.41325 type:complete len:219 (+) Transcript_14505:755-1411(+)
MEELARVVARPRAHDPAVLQHVAQLVVRPAAHHPLLPELPRLLLEQAGRRVLDGEGREGDLILLRQAPHGRLDRERAVLHRGPRAALRPRVDGRLQGERVDVVLLLVAAALVQTERLGLGPHDDPPHLLQLLPYLPDHGPPPVLPLPQRAGGGGGGGVGVRRRQARQARRAARPRPRQHGRPVVEVVVVVVARSRSVVPLPAVRGDPKKRRWRRRPGR